jgi:DNA-binding Xre family transcriptional regulator
MGTLGQGEVAPNLEADSGNTPDMVHYLPAKTVLWRNVSTLMRERWGRTNLTRLAKEAGIGDFTVHRLKETDATTVGLDIVDKIAGVFKREPWQLLAPQGPGQENLSADARRLAAKFDSLPDEQKNRAYALIEQILEFGNIGQS